MVGCFLTLGKAHINTLPKRCQMKEKAYNSFYLNGLAVILRPEVRRLATSSHPSKYQGRTNPAILKKYCAQR